MQFKSQYIIGSWNGSDGSTGAIRSKPVMIENSVLVGIPFIHGPDISHQKIGLKIEGHGSIELLCDLNSMRYSWGLCQFDLSSYVGRKLTVFAEDRGGIQNNGSDSPARY